MPAKILVVDDEIAPLTRLIEQFFEKNIEEKDYEFLYAKDGIEALEKVHKFRPDLILTDIKMPRLDGLEFLHKLNEEKLNIKTIILSAYGTVDYFKQALYERAYDFLVKPIDRTELENSIRRVLLLPSDFKISQDSLPSTYKKRQPPNVNYHSVLRLAKQLPPHKQLDLFSELIPNLPLEEVDNLEKNFPALKQRAQEVTEEKERLTKEDEKRRAQNQLSLLWLQDCYVDVQRHLHTTKDGQTREYNYIYLRWTDPETKKLKGRRLKKKELQDPQVRRIIEEKCGKTIDFL